MNEDVDFGAETFSLTSESLAKAIDSTQQKATAASDFLFLIDCTQTMQWVIDTLVDTITELVEMFEEEGLRMRYGVVEFRDMLRDKEDIRMIHHTFESNSHFTSKPDSLKSVLSSLKAKGGGPPKESVFEAFKVGLSQSDWRHDSAKIVVLLTDCEGPLSPDLTVKNWKGAIECIESADLDMLHVVRKPEHKSEFERFSRIEGRDGEDLPVFILDLGDSPASKKQLIDTLKGIGYSSRKQARKKRNQQRYRDE